MKKIKIKTIELSQFVGKPIQELYDYVKKEYPNQLPFDGIDFYDNENLKDGNYHFFFGSVFRLDDGYWNVPYVQWDGSSFSRYGFWLVRGWVASCRVVILDDVKSLPLPSDLLKRIEKLEKKVFNK